ncbi:retrovirus-related pol polyprotein from transposon TNT 1-94 [Tanacetum coccineum]
MFLLQQKSTVPSQLELDLLFGPLHTPFNETFNLHQKPSTHYNAHAEENNMVITNGALPSINLKILNNRWTKEHPLIQVCEIHPTIGKQDDNCQQIRNVLMIAITVKIVLNPKNIKEAMADSAWIETMQEELHQFDRLQVWEHRWQHKPFGKELIKLSGYGKKQRDEDQTVIRNNATTFSKGLLLPGRVLNFDESFDPDGFVDPDHPDKVYRLRKALYGLKQAPRAWYDELSKFLISKGFSKGLQIHQSPRGIFINQAKYTLEILKKHGMEKGQSIGTPMTTKPKLDADLSGEPVDQTDYRSKIGSLMYLTSSRPDIVQAVCTIHMGLWYPKDSGFDLTAFSQMRSPVCLDTPKALLEGTQFLGDKV